MKKNIRLNETELIKLINVILEDSTEKIFTDIDKVYDYKIQNNTWFAKHKTGTEWMDISDYPKAIELLNKKTGNNVVPIIPPKPDPTPVPKPKPEDETKLTPQQKLMKAKACGFNSWIDYKSSGFKCGKKPVPKPIDKSDTIVSKTTSPRFLKKIAFREKEISTTKSTPIFTAGQPQCAKFVHDFDPKLPGVNDAWLAHNNDQIGSRIFTVFQGLPSDKVKKITDLWVKMDKSGGPKSEYIDDAMNLVRTLITKSPPKLQLNDIVGIFYPPSDNHAIAFYSGGKNAISGNQPYILKKNGKYVPGNTLKSGSAWGMNTHVGIVGAIKNGVPIIFHNIHGQVYSDPYNNLTDNSRIVWVRRPGDAEPIALNKIKSSIPSGAMTENTLVNRLKKKL